MLIFLSQGVQQVTDVMFLPRKKHLIQSAGGAFNKQTIGSSLNVCVCKNEELFVHHASYPALYTPTFNPKWSMQSTLWVFAQKSACYSTTETRNIIFMTQKLVDEVVPEYSLPSYSSIHVVLTMPVHPCRSITYRCQHSIHFVSDWLLHTLPKWSCQSVYHSPWISFENGSLTG